MLAERSAITQSKSDGLSSKVEFPIGQLPQAFLGPTALPTQVDIKSRWPDSSLKHAILSFLIPTFSAGQAYTITLASGSTVGNSAITQAQMLSVAFNFDAKFKELTSGAATKTASARTMLTNGDYTVWAGGPIATTIILVNHAQTVSCGENRRPSMISASIRTAHSDRNLKRHFGLPPTRYLSGMLARSLIQNNLKTSPLQILHSRSAVLPRRQFIPCPALFLWALSPVGQRRLG